MTLTQLPAQAPDVSWPTQAWPEGDLPKGLDRTRFDALMDKGFADFGETHAVVVVQGGRLIFERYGPDHGPDKTCLSWSKAKSITQALAGLIVGDGKLDIFAPADVPEWKTPGDPRGAITLDLLLRMSSGLEFSEVYLPDQPSDTIAMLWGEGKDDAAHYAADKPLAHPPGSFFSYSSGTTNIVARTLSRALGAYGPDFEAYMRTRLFEPLGMTSPIPKFDKAGTFLGSSFCFTPPVTSPASACSICATGSGRTAACCRRVGSTTREPPPSNKPTAQMTPTALTGGWASAGRAVSRPMAMRASTRSAFPTSTWSSSATAKPPPSAATT